MTSVLLVRLSAMGDVVQSLGAVRALRAARPDWRLTFVTQTEHAPLLDEPGLVDRIVAFDRGGGLAAVRALRRALRGERQDCVIDLQGNWKSAFVARLVRAGDRVGMDARWRQEPWSRLLLGRVVACDATPHPARAAWELVKQVAPDVPFALPRLLASPDERARERDAVRGAGLDPDRPFRVVVATDPRDPRALVPAMVAEAVGGDPPGLALLGPDVAAAPDGVAATLRHGRGDVRRLVGLGAVLASAEGEVLGPDRGPTHVLIAAGARGRVVFGSQDPRRTAPPSAAAVVRADPPRCQPCRSRRCRNPLGVECMPFDLVAAREVDVGLPPEGAVGPGPWPDA